MVTPEVREAVAAPPAATPGEYVRLALDRLSLAVRLAERARDDARAAGLTSEGAIGVRTRQARKELRHLASAILRDARSAGIEVPA